MKKAILLFCFYLLLVSAFAQITTTPEKETPKTTPPNTTATAGKPKAPANTDKFFKKENLALGGGINFSLGSGFVSVGLAPEVAYFLVPSRVIVGARMYYNFYKDNYYDVKSNFFGGGPFVRGYIYKGLFAQVEYEFSSVEQFYVDPLYNRVVGKERIGYNAVFVGGGFHQNFDSGVGFYILVLYNVLQTTDFIYPNPQFRTGVTYSFGGRR